jgi:hypothetical protein
MGGGRHRQRRGDLPRHQRRPRPLRGAAPSTWATAAAATPEATPRRQDGALERVAWSHACVAGNLAADHRLGSPGTSSTARTSTAAHGGMAVAAGAVHRPLRR